MLEALPMAGFIPGNITNGPCGISVGAGGMSFDRLVQKNTDAAFRAQALDLATGKSEHVDLEAIGIYKLKVGKAVYRHRVTNEVIEEQTLVAPDFGGEAIGVWTSAGENRLGNPKEYERIVKRARTLAQTAGETAMFWVSPGEAGFDGKPEHRAYLWKKNRNDEVTAYAYQLSGSRESLVRMMKKLDYRDGEKKIEDQVILTSNSATLNSGKVFGSYVDSLTEEEKDRQVHYLEKFRRELQQSDIEKFDKLEDYQRKYEAQLKAVYKGDIESALKSVLHGMLSLTSESVRDFPKWQIQPTPDLSGRILQSGMNEDLIRNTQTEDWQNSTAKTGLLKPVDAFIPVFAGKGENPIGIDKVWEKKILDRLELVKKILIQAVIPQEKINLTVADLSEVKAKEKTLIMQTEAVDRNNPHTLFSQARVIPTSNTVDFSFVSMDGGINGEKERSDLKNDSSSSIQQQDYLLNIVSKILLSTPNNSIFENQAIETQGGRQTGSVQINTDVKKMIVPVIPKEGDDAELKEKCLSPFEKIIVTLAVIGKLPEISSLHFPEEISGDKFDISDAALDAVCREYRKVHNANSRAEVLKTENLSGQKLEEILSNPVFLIRTYESSISKGEKVMIAVIMNNWLNGRYQKNGNREQFSNDHIGTVMPDRQFWEDRRMEYRRMLIWLIEIIKLLPKEEYARAELEIMVEIILILCILADRQDIFNFLMSFEGQKAAIVDSGNRWKMERKPADFSQLSYPAFFTNVKPKKLKKMDIIYRYQDLIFVPCQAKGKYDRI